jgi:putative ABC transport system permease protein
VNIITLLRIVSLSHLKSEKLKVFLTVAGMAFGIAIFCAIRAANQNAWDAFAESTKLLTPGTDLELSGDSGMLPESIIPQILAVPGVRGVLPWSSTYLSASAGGKPLGSIQLIGSDLLALGENGPAHRNSSKPSSPPPPIVELLRREHAVLISPTLHARLSAPALTLTVNSRPVDFEVLGDIPDPDRAEAFGGNLVFIDISHFQDVLGHWGDVDRLGILLTNPENPEPVKQTIIKLLPPHVHFTAPDERARHAQKMTQAFRLNLNFLSCISLFVALLLIYNTMSFSILKRRAELSILRSLGCPAKSLFLFLTAESIVLGLISSAVGIMLGGLLSRYTVSLVSASFSTLYLPVSVSTVHLPASLVIQCLLLGPLLAAAGSIFPSCEVYYLPPRAFFAAQQYESPFRRKLPLLSAASAICLAIAVLTAQKQWLRFSLYMGFVSPTFLLLAVSLATPLLLTAVLSLGRFLQPEGLIELSLAFDHIRMSLRRSSVAVAAMLVSLGLFVGVSMMILSFRMTVREWIEHITAADLYISAERVLGGGTTSYLPEAVVRYLTEEAGADDFDFVSGRRVLIGERWVKINGVRFDSLRRHRRLLLKEKLTDAEYERLLSRADVCLISETFANRFNVSAGSRIDIPGVERSSSFEVGGVYYDYSSDQGAISIDFPRFRELFAESRKEALSLYINNAEERERIRQELYRRFPSETFTVRDNAALRADVLDVFDDTFRVTYALQAIALLIAGLTVANTLLMLMFERKREFAVMRALGASSRSLTKMIVMESLILGFTAVIGAWILGFGLALLLVYVINRFFFGWSIAFLVPLNVLAEMSLGTMLLSFAAGYLPGRKVTAAVDSRELRYE